MYLYFPYMQYPNQFGIESNQSNPYGHDFVTYSNYTYQNPNFSTRQQRQQPIRGQATWTDGGQVTKCGIPWSDDAYMTAAVGENSPYQCGETLKIRNISAPYGREILVKVVDQVADYPSNRINLHRRAFQALGLNPNVGVINIEIIPSPELEQEEWGKYLMELTQVAYPGYNIIEYRSLGREIIAPSQVRESYEFILQSSQETIRIQGNVIYNPTNDRIISFGIREVQ